MTSLKSLKSEIIEELKQQRYRAALALDLALVTELNKQINNINNHIAANKVPSKGVVARRAKIAAKADARQCEIIPVDHRMTLTMVEMGLRSVESIVDLFELTEAQRSLYDEGWWRLGTGTLRHRITGLTKERQYNAIREELDGPAVLEVRETKGGIRIHFQPTELGNVVARVQVSNANAVRKALVQLVACLDTVRISTQCSTVSLPSAFKPEIVSVLKHFAIPETEPEPEHIDHPVSVREKKVKKAKQPVDHMYQNRIALVSAGRYQVVVPENATCDTEVQCTCCTCDHAWSTTVVSLLSGRGCKKCAVKTRAKSRSVLESTAIKNVLKVANEKGWSFNGFKDGWVGTNKSRLLLTCHCGCEWTPVYTGIVCTGTGCPACAGKVRIEKLNK